MNPFLELELTLKFLEIKNISWERLSLKLARAVTVGETEGAMDSTSVFILPLLLPITL